VAISIYFFVHCAYHLDMRKKPKPDSLPSSQCWITAQEYSRLTGIAKQTLANWRMADCRDGEIPPDRPVWRRFGSAIRYWAGDLAPRRELRKSVDGENDSVSTRDVAV
jgi:hypothetical protein